MTKDHEKSARIGREAGEAASTVIRELSSKLKPEICQNCYANSFSIALISAAMKQENMSFERAVSQLETLVSIILQEVFLDEKGADLESPPSSPDKRKLI